jgi:hypothetical protein
MERFTRIAVFLVGFLTVATLAYGEKPTQALQPSIVLTLPDGKDFTIPVSAATTADRRGGLIPVGKGHVVALRVVPRAEDGDVVVDISALMGDVQGDDADLSCARAKNWSRQEVVGSYRLGMNDSLPLSDLERYGLAPMGVKFVPVMTTTGCSGCGCGSLCCYPNPNQCLTCGPCGQCCNFP